MKIAYCIRKNWKVAHGGDVVQMVNTKAEIEKVYNAKHEKAKETINKIEEDAFNYLKKSLETNNILSELILDYQGVRINLVETL